MKKQKLIKKLDPIKPVESRRPSTRTPTRAENEFADLVKKEKRKGCVLCGVSKPLNFHHIHPAKKKFLISGAHPTRSLYELKAELRKCVVLCVMCHKDVHSYRAPTPRIKNSYKYRELQKYATYKI